MKFYVNKFFTYTIRKTSLLFNPIMHEQESGWLKNFLLRKRKYKKKDLKNQTDILLTLKLDSRSLPLISIIIWILNMLCGTYK